MDTRRSAVGLLRQPNFRRLFVSTAVSQTGHRIGVVALPLVAVLNLNVSAFQIGVLTALNSVAFLIIGLPAGAWVDRMRRRRVLISGELGRAVVFASVPIAWAMGMLTIWQLYAVATLVGLFVVFFDVAYQSYLPHLVGRENLMEGNAKLESVRSVAFVGGPSIGGQLAQWLTAPVAILANSVALVISAAILLRIRNPEPRPKARPGRSLVADIREGLRFVAGHRLLRPIAASTAMFNLFFSAYLAMLVVFLVRAVGLGAGEVGLVLSIGSIGSVIGALYARRIVTWLGQGRVMWMVVAFSSPFTLLMPMTFERWAVWVAAVGQGTVFFGVVIYNVAQVSFRQAITPDRLLGRMNATMRFLVWGTMPIGSFAGGVLGETIGVRQTLFLSAGGATAAFLLVYFSPLRHMRQLPTKVDTGS